MAKLLLSLPESHRSEIYIQNLIMSFKPGATQPVPSADAKEDMGKKLVEPLSERELEILTCLAEGLSNREIGQRLSISLPTVKTHTRNIYSKLGVNNRTRAVAQARTWGLLS
jgi:LuxR family maltose regulon positive regulatory protein